MINKPYSGDHSAHNRAVSIDRHHRQCEHHGVTVNTNSRPFMLISSAAFVLIWSAAQQLVSGERDRGVFPEV